MQVSYCERWNFLRNRPIGELSEDEAHRRDEAGALYTVVLGDPAGPEKIVEVLWENAHAGVIFFDRLQRQSLHYSFRRVGTDRMFLTSIRNWRYADDNARLINQASVIEEITYGEDGVVHHDVRDKLAGEVRSSDHRDVNLDLNWEPVPTFGDWNSIARYERGATALPTQQP